MTAGARPVVETAGVDPRAVAERLLLAALAQQDVAGAATASAERALHLARTSHALALSLDETATRDAVRRVTLPRPGTWSLVEIVEADGSLHRLTPLHPNTAQQRLASTLDRRWPAPLAAAAPATSRFKPTLLTHASSAALLRVVRGEDSLRTLRQLGFASLLVVPMVVRARVQGAITFVCPVGGAPFSSDEMALGVDLAAHCAMALDNAGRYQQAMTLRAAGDVARRSKAALLATMSHELRTPLDAIAGSVDLIDLGLQGSDRPEQQRALQRIRVNHQQLLTLTTEIVEFARAEGGWLDDRRVEVSMPLAIAAVVQMLAAVAAVKGLTLFAVKSAPHTIAWADPDRVRHILGNLVMNAIKLTPANGGVIRVTSYVKGDQACIQVADRGPGIPRNELQAIFDPFVPLAEGIADRPEGDGGGLAISRDLALTMGGELTVESTLGVGSRFLLTLPLARSKQGAVRSGAGQVRSSRAAPRHDRLGAAARMAGGVRLRDVERFVIERTMEQVDQNQSRAARILGISRPTLSRKLRSYRAHPNADGRQ